MPRFENLNPKSRDFKSRLGGCKIGIINGELFSKTNPKTKMTLSLILWFNLRLGGYSIWSASTSRTIYDQDFGLEHLTASEQPEVHGGLLDVPEGRPRNN